jgi:hypothetical protein
MENFRPNESSADTDSPQLALDAGAAHWLNFSPKLYPEHGQNEYLREHGFDRDKVEQPAPTPQGAGSWTVLVNLSANMLLSNVALKIGNQLQEQKLIDSTRGKPIKIIVQTTLNDDPRLNHANIDDPNPKQPMRSEPESTSVVRYEISDGEKRLLGYGRSKGFSEDLKTLLTADPQAMKAEHIALMGEAHGLNLAGFEGDSGSVDLAKFKSTVKDALKQAGRDNLDVLDLVSCDMASAQAIHELSDITKYTIASEEEQTAYRKSADELLAPIALPISRLIQNTQMDPKDFGKTIIQSNTDICKGNAAERYATNTEDLHACAANTLGLYNESATAKLSASIEHLGSALSSLMGNPKNKEAITQITTNLPKVYTDPVFALSTDNEEKEQKDLGMLVTNLEDGVKNKTIKDTTSGDLSKALQEVKAAMNDTIVTHFNSTSLGMGIPKELAKRGLPDVPLSGLSVFLPLQQSVLGDRFGKEAHGTFEGKFSFDRGQFEAALTRQDFSVFTTTPVKNDLIEQRDVLMKYIPSIKSQPSKDEMEAFLRTSSRFMTWLNSAANLKWQDRENQFLDYDFQISDNLRALMNDTNLWKEIGALKAKEHFDRSSGVGSISSQPQWNKFIEGLSQQ